VVVDASKMAHMRASGASWLPISREMKLKIEDGDGDAVSRSRRFYAGVGALKVQLDLSVGASTFKK
jgi:hypothetical protein